MNPDNQRARLLGLLAVGLSLFWFDEVAHERLHEPQRHVEVAVAPPAPTALPADRSARFAAAPPRVAPVAVAGPGGVVDVAAGEALFAVHGDRDAVAEALLAAGARWFEIGEGSGLGRVAFGEDLPLDQVRERLLGVPGIGGLRGNPIVRGAQSAATACGPGDLVGYQWERPRIHSTTVCNADSSEAPVTIAILDTGVAYEDRADASGSYLVAPELDGVPIVDPYDFVNMDSHANDDHQHGTHLAGLIASRDRLRGHAPNPVLMPVKVLDDQMVGTEWSLVEGIHWAADHGAQVINLSLTFPAAYLPSGELLDAVAEAHLAGAVVVAAAGNEDAELIAHPAALPGVIAVGAYRGSKPGDDPKYTDYSNIGPGLDVMGPGGRIDEDKNEDQVPDGMLAQTMTPGDPTTFAYWSIAGTSQATAVVSGQVAQLIGQGADARSARDHVMMSARSVEKRDEAGLLKEGLGYVDSAALDGTESQIDVTPVFVNVLAAVARPDDKKVRLEAYVRVIDAHGAPVPDARVHGQVRGSIAEYVTDKTDDDGVAFLETDKVEVGIDGPAIFMLQIDAVLRESDEVWSRSGRQRHHPRDKCNGDYPVEPGGFYGLDAGSLDLMSAVVGTTPGAPLLYRVSSADATGTEDDTDLCELFDCDKLDTSYVLRSQGSGLSSSTVSVAFNWPFVQSVTGSGLSSSTVNVSLSQSFYFPWGSSTEEPLEVWDLTGSGLSSSTVNILRWNPRSFWTNGSGLSSSTVNVLSFDPRVYGVGHAASEVYLVEDGSSTWGSGLSSSTVNALDLFGPSMGGGLSGWGQLLGTSFATQTIAGMAWTGVPLPASAGQVVEAASTGTLPGVGAAPTGL